MDTTTKRLVLVAVFTAGALIGALIAWALPRPVQTVTLDGRSSLLTVAGDCVEVEVIHNGVAERLRSAGCDGVPVPSSTPTTAAATPTRGRGTATPGATGTPPATSTAGPPATATPTSQPPGHDLTAWHEPGVNFHHHGADPLGPDVHPEIVAWLEEHEWGPLFTAVGHPWTSSPIENLIKHQGFVNLAEADTGCDMGRQEPGPGDLCIKAYLYQVHAWPISDEVRARVHSWKAVFWVCDFDLSECGVVAAGGHQDYGERTAAYKRATCDFADNPPYRPEHQHEQPPYLAGVGTGSDPAVGRGLFWNSDQNPVTNYAFDIVPNQLLQSAWVDQPWRIMDLDPAKCQQQEFDYYPCPDGSCWNSGRRFQMFTLRLQIEDLPRPFEGYVDMYGRVAPECTAVGPNCAPLYISGDVPEGQGRLNRVVNPLNPEMAPFLIYGEGAELLPPGTYPLAAPAATIEPAVEPYP